MIRFVIMAVAAVAAWFLLFKLYQSVKHAKIDWTGIAAIIGFVVLAFYLRHVTGMG